MKLNKNLCYIFFVGYIIKPSLQKKSENSEANIDVIAENIISILTIGALFSFQKYFFF